MAISNDIKTLTSTLASMTFASPSPASMLAFPGIHGESNFNDDNVIIVNADHNPRLPNGIVVAILMVVGILGNMLVLYVYHFKMERTVFSTFVIVLAMLDISTTLLGMPIDVALKSILFGKEQVLDAVCKIAHFEVYTTSLASGSVLLLITITRYKKVCKPLEPGLTLNKARLSCAVIVACAASLCTVTFIINGMEKVRITVGEREKTDYNGTNQNAAPSTIPGEFAINPLRNNTDLFNIQTSAPDLSTTTLPQLAATFHTSESKKTFSSTSSQNIPTNSTETGAKGEQTDSNDTVHSTNKAGTAAGRKVKEVVEVYICRTSESKKGTALYYILQALLMSAFIIIFISLLILHCKISTSVAEFERRRSSMRRFSSMSDQESHLTQITGTMYRIFVTITIIFLVSYLPHLICLVIERVIYKPGEAIPKTVRVVLDLAYNFPYINVVANPFIYGYKSTKFRRHCLRIFRTFCTSCCPCVCRARYYR